MLLVWLISVVGILLDKFVYTFPWMGLATNIGGIQVDVSRGWDIDGGFEKRAAGFFRSSISAAMLLPILAAIIAPRIRSWTAAAAVSRADLRRGGTDHPEGRTGRGGGRQPRAVHADLELLFALCTACIAFALVDVALPLFTAGVVDAPERQRVQLRLLRHADRAHLA